MGNTLTGVYKLSFKTRGDGMNNTENEEGKISETVIDRYGCSLTILAYRNDKLVLVDDDELKWNLYDGEYDGYLTLAEIACQLINLGYDPVFRIWWEIGLRGVIYRYGNYDPPTWEKHGTTKGYA